MPDSKRTSTAVLTVFIATLSLATLTSADAVKEGVAETFVKVKDSVVLEASEFKFEPDKLEIPVDREVTLRLKNEGVVAHNILVIKNSKSKTKIESIQKGESDTLKIRFSETGTYEFYCNVPGHKQAGMRGVIRVVEPRQE